MTSGPCLKNACAIDELSSNKAAHLKHRTNQTTTGLPWGPWNRSTTWGVVAPQLRTFSNPRSSIINHQTLFCPLTRHYVSNPRSANPSRGFLTSVSEDQPPTPLRSSFVRIGKRMLLDAPGREGETHVLEILDRSRKSCRSFTFALDSARPAAHRGDNLRQGKLLSPVEISQLSWICPCSIRSPDGQTRLVGWTGFSCYLFKVCYFLSSRCPFFARPLFVGQSTCQVCFCYSQANARLSCPCTLFIHARPSLLAKFRPVSHPSPALLLHNKLFWPKDWTKHGIRATSYIFVMLTIARLLEPKTHTLPPVQLDATV